MARGSTEFEDLAGWLGHSTRGGGGNFLRDWKKKGECNTFMHTKRLPLAIWRHKLPVYQLIEAKDTKDKVKHVYSKNFVCHENEDVLENPWRDKVTGDREHPPQRCGICKFESWLWEQCVAWCETHTWDTEKKMWTKTGKSEGLDPTALLFDYISDADDDENLKVFVGGFCNFFGQKKLSEDVKSAMRKKKIRGDETWKQNSKVKCSYALTIVNNDDVGKGVLIAVETQALGERVKEVINKTMKSMKINILKNPYCIQWEYDESAAFDKKYDATAMMDIKPSPRVLKLIRGEAPDLQQLKEPFNQQSMRTQLEEHCLIKNIPWDDFFPTKAQEKKWALEDQREEQEAADSSEDEADNKEEEEEEDGDQAECDNCEKLMPIDASECPHCHHKYEVEKEDEEEEEEEEPAPKKKVEAKAKVKSPPPEEEEDEEEDEEEEEEEEPAPKKKVEAKAKTKTKIKPEPEPEEEEEEEEDEEDDEDEEEEEKPAQKSKASASKANGKPAPKKAAAKAFEDFSEEDDDGDDIPF